MKTLSSSEFRRTYSELDEPVVVTAYGHAIGTWTPVQLPPGLRVVIPERVSFGHPTPAPKPGKKR